MRTKSWKDIPSLENVEVDWDYEPINSLGKRSHLRLSNKNLSLFFNNENILVNVASCKSHETGDLFDISQSGLAILLHDTELKKGSLTKVNLQIGERKFISKAVVRNISSFEGQDRIGFEFVDPAVENSMFIKRLINSKAYCI